MKRIIVLALFLACATSHAEDNIVARLHRVRSLSCVLTWNNSTVFKDGTRSLDSEQKKYTFKIDNIDLVKGTARYLDSSYAGDLSVRWSADSLSFTSQRMLPTYITTVFPQYAVGTQDFFVVESRHINSGFMMAGQAYGSCSVVE
jgi:hypothetical protein